MTFQVRGENKRVEVEFFFLGVSNKKRQIIWPTKLKRKEKEVYIYIICIYTNKYHNGCHKRGVRMVAIDMLGCEKMSF